MAEYRLFELMREQEVQQNQRALAKKNVDTYAIDSLVVHELLQNALDAIQKSDTESGRIELTLDIDKRTVEIIDNGCGFPHNKRLLLLGGTDKDGGDASHRMKGNLGVGLKAVYLSSSEFRIDAVTEQGRWGASISNGYLFENQDPQFIFDDNPKPSAGVNNGTRIEVTFPGDEVKEFTDQMVKAALNGVSREVAPEI